MNSFQLGVPGGGNLGFAVDARTELSIQIAPQDIFEGVNAPVSANTKALVEYVVTKWRNTFPCGQHYRVRVKSQVPEHVGFASSSALQLACIAALNWIHGCPLTDEGLRHRVARDYREANGGEVVPGFTTGLSSFLNLYGGFAVVDESLAGRFHCAVPAWNYAIVRHPSHSKTSHGEDEYATLMNNGRTLDRGRGSEKNSILNERLIPAITRGNLELAGDAVASLQRIGSKRAEIALHGSELYEIMDGLRTGGVECAFLSAVGPGICLITAQGHSAMAELARDHGLTIVKAGSLDSIGVRIDSIQGY